MISQSTKGMLQQMLDNYLYEVEETEEILNSLEDVKDPTEDDIDQHRIVDFARYLLEEAGTIKRLSRALKMQVEYTLCLDKLKGE